MLGWQIAAQSLRVSLLLVLLSSAQQCYYGASQAPLQQLSTGSNQCGGTSVCLYMLMNSLAWAAVATCGVPIMPPSLTHICVSMSRRSGCLGAYDTVQPCGTDEAHHAACAPADHAPRLHHQHLISGRQGCHQGAGCVLRIEARNDWLESDVLRGERVARFCARPDIC